MAELFNNIKIRWREAMRSRGIKSLYEVGFLEPHEDGLPHANIAILVRPEDADAAFRELDLSVWPASSSAERRPAGGQLLRRGRDITLDRTASDEMGATVPGPLGWLRYNAKARLVRNPNGGHPDLPRLLAWIRAFAIGRAVWQTPGSVLDKRLNKIEGTTSVSSPRVNSGSLYPHQAPRNIGQDGPRLNETGAKKGGTGGMSDVAAGGGSAEGGPVRPRQAAYVERLRAKGLTPINVIVAEDHAKAIKAAAKASKNGECPMAAIARVLAVSPPWEDERADLLRQIDAERDAHLAMCAALAAARNETETLRATNSRLQAQFDLILPLLAEMLRRQGLEGRSRRHGRRRPYRRA